MKYIPYEKMSKSRKKEIDRRKRNTWGSVKPIVRVHKSKKAYDRKKLKAYQLF